MFELKIENQTGTLHLANIVKVEGLGLPDREVKLGYSPGLGKAVLHAAFLPRTVTVTLRLRQNAAYMMERLVRITEGSVRLTFVFGTKRRAISALCTGFRESRDEQGADLVLTFLCGDPSFTDEEQKSVAVFRRDKLIKTTFILPTPFSKRICEVDVVNRGDADTLPTLLIYDNSEANSPEPTNGLLELINDTTGARIALSCTTLTGEVVTVNTAEGTITSNYRGDMAAYLSDDSYLTDFCLVRGPNHIRVQCEDQTRDISALCVYENHYLEAVY